MGVYSNMRWVDVSEKDAENGVKWKWRISKANTKREKEEKEKIDKSISVYRL